MEPRTENVQLSVRKSDRRLTMIIVLEEVEEELFELDENPLATENWQLKVIKDRKQVASRVAVSAEEFNKTVINVKDKNAVIDNENVDGDDYASAKLSEQNEYIGADAAGPRYGDLEVLDRISVAPDAQGFDSASDIVAGAAGSISRGDVSVLSGPTDKSQLYSLDELPPDMSIVYEEPAVSDILDEIEDPAITMYGHQMSEQTLELRGSVSSSIEEGELRDVLTVEGGDQDKVRILEDKRKDWYEIGEQPASQIVEQTLRKESTADIPAGEVQIADLSLTDQPSLSTASVEDVQIGSGDVNKQSIPSKDTSGRGQFQDGASDSRIEQTSSDSPSVSIQDVACDELEQSLKEGRADSSFEQESELFQGAESSIETEKSPDDKLWSNLDNPTQEAQNTLDTNRYDETSDISVSLGVPEVTEKLTAADRVESFGGGPSGNLVFNKDHGVQSQNADKPMQSQNESSQKDLGAEVTDLDLGRSVQDANVGVVDEPAGNQNLNKGTELQKSQKDGPKSEQSDLGSEVTDLELGTSEKDAVISLDEEPASRQSLSRGAELQKSQDGQPKLDQSGVGSEISDIELGMSVKGAGVGVDEESISRQSLTKGDDLQKAKDGQNKPQQSNVGSEVTDIELGMSVKAATVGVDEEPANTQNLFRGDELQPQKSQSKSEQSGQIGPSNSDRDSQSDWKSSERGLDDVLGAEVVPDLPDGKDLIESIGRSDLGHLIKPSDEPLTSSSDKVGADVSQTPEAPPVVRGPDPAQLEQAEERRGRGRVVRSMLEDVKATLEDTSTLPPAHAVERLEDLARTIKIADNSLGVIESDLERLKQEWNLCPSDCKREDDDKAIATALHRLDQLKGETRDRGRQIQNLLEEKHAKDEALDMLGDRTLDLESWLQDALCIYAEESAPVSNYNYIQDQINDCQTIFSDVDGKLGAMKKAQKEYDSLAAFDDPAARQSKQERLKDMVDQTSGLKSKLKDKIGKLKEAAEKSRVNQERLSSFEEALGNMNRQVSEMLGSDILPSGKDREALSQLPQHKSELSKNLKSGLQDHRQLVRDIANQQGRQDVPAEQSSEAGKIPEDLARARLLALRQAYAQLCHQGSEGDSVDPLDPQDELGRLLDCQKALRETLPSIGQWVDSVEADLLLNIEPGTESHHDKLNEFKMIRENLADIEKGCQEKEREIGQVVELPASVADHNTTVDQSLRLLDDKLRQLESDIEDKDASEAQKKQWLANMKDSLGEMERQLERCQKEYSSLDPATSDLPLDRHQTLTSQLEATGKEALRNLEELKTQMEMRFLNDPKYSVPPELCKLEQQWRRFLPKLDERREELNRLHHTGTQYESALERFAEYLETAHDKLNTDTVIAADVNQLQDQLKKNQTFFHDLQAQQTHLDELASKLDPMTKQRYRSSHTRLNNLARGVTDKAKTRDQRLQYAGDQWKDLNERLKRESDKLDELSSGIPGTSQATDSLEEVMKNLKRLQELRQALDGEKGTVMRDVKKANEILKDVKSPELEQAASELGKKFEQISAKVNGELKKHGDWVDHGKQFNTDSAKLEEWLKAADKKVNDVKDLLKGSPTPADVNKATKILLDLKVETDNNTSAKVSLASSAAKLLRLNPENKIVKDRLKNIESDWIKVTSEFPALNDQLTEAQTQLLPSTQALSDLMTWLSAVSEGLQQDQHAKPSSQGDVSEILNKLKYIKADVDNHRLAVDYVNQCSADQVGGGSKPGSAETLGEINRSYESLVGQVREAVDRVEGLNQKWLGYEGGVRGLKDWLGEQQGKISGVAGRTEGADVIEAGEECKKLQDSLKDKLKELEQVQKIGKQLAADSLYPAEQKTINDNNKHLSDSLTSLDKQLKQLQKDISDKQKAANSYNTAVTAVESSLADVRSRLTAIGRDMSSSLAATNQSKLLKELKARVSSMDPVFTELSNSGKLLKARSNPEYCLILDEQTQQLKNRWNDLKSDLDARIQAADDLQRDWLDYEKALSSANKIVADRESDLEKFSEQEQKLKDEDNIKQIEALLKKLDDLAPAEESLEGTSNKLLPKVDDTSAALISGDRAQLDRRAAGLRDNLSKRLANLRSNADKRQKLQKGCAEIESFLTAADKTLKSLDSGEPISDQESKERLKKAEDLSASFTDRQPELVALNHLGYTLPLDAGDANRLKDISHRWQTLQGDANDKHGHYQRQVLLREDFGEKCRDWQEYVERTERGVEEMERGGSDYDSLVKQLQLVETFQQDTPTKQQILYSIIGDGRMMIESGDVKNKPDFERRLKLLLDQWLGIVKRINQRKGVIDNEIGLWRTYNEHLGKVRNMLDDVKSTVEDLETKPITPSIEATRQNIDKYKTLKADLAAVEPHYNKVDSYSALLIPTVSKLEASRIAEEVKSTRQDMTQLDQLIDGNVRKLGSALDLWIESERGVEEYMMWLKECQKGLQADLPDSYDDLTKELAKLKDLSKSLSPADPRLTKLQDNTAQLSKHLSSEELLSHRQWVELLKSRQEELSDQVANRMHLIGGKLGQWEEFDTDYKDLMKRMVEAESEMFDTDKISMEDIVESLQSGCDEELKRLDREKKEFDKRGEELRQHCNDVRASDIQHKINALGGQWDKLNNNVAVRLKKLMDTLAIVKQLEQNMLELRQWLQRTEHQLSTPIVFQRPESNELKQHIKKHQDLLKDIDMHNLPVASVIDLCDNLIRDIDACPTQAEAQTLQLARDTLEHRWKNITDKAAKRKIFLDETLPQWQKISTDGQTMSRWLDSQDKHLSDPRSREATFDDMREECVRIKNFQDSLEQQRGELEQLNRCYCKLAREGRTDSSGSIRRNVDEINDKWDRLNARATAIVRRLSHLLSVRDDFDANRQALILWLANLSDALTECGQLDEPSIAEVCRAVRQELNSNIPRVDYVYKAGNYLIQKCEPRDAALIQQDVDEFQLLQDSVQSQLDSLERVSAGHLRSPHAVNDEAVRRIKNKIESGMKASANQLEAAVGKVDNDYDSRLSDPSDPSDDSSASRKSAGRRPITALDTSRSRAPVGSELSDVEIELQQLEDWLDGAEALLGVFIVPPEDLPQFQQRMKEHQELVAGIESWRNRVNSIRGSLAQLVQQGGSRGSVGHLASRISQGTNRYDAVCRRAQDWKHQLEQSLQHKFRENVGDLAAWLEESREELLSLELDRPIAEDVTYDELEGKRMVISDVTDDCREMQGMLDSFREVADYLLDNSGDSLIDMEEDRAKMEALNQDVLALLQACEDGRAVLEGQLGRQSRGESDGYFSRASSQPSSTPYNQSKKARFEARQRHRKNAQKLRRTPMKTDYDTAGRRALGLLGRACRAAVPIQALMMLLLGAASVVPVCEQNCLGSIMESLSFPNGPPPI